MLARYTEGGTRQKQWREKLRKLASIDKKQCDLIYKARDPPCIGLAQKFTQFFPYDVMETCT